MIMHRRTVSSDETTSPWDTRHRITLQPDAHHRIAYRISLRRITCANPHVCCCSVVCCPLTCIERCASVAYACVMCSRVDLAVTCPLTLASLCVSLSACFVSSSSSSPLSSSAHVRIPPLHIRHRTVRSAYSYRHIRRHPLVRSTHHMSYHVHGSAACARVRGGSRVAVRVCVLI